MPTTISQDELDELMARARKHRETTGESVGDLAKRAGIPAPILSQMLCGTYKSSPSFDRVKSICRAIGVRIRFEDE